MNTVAAVLPMPPRRVLGAYLEEARSECLRYLRAPSFILPVTLFSTVFYLMFGVLLNHAGSDASRYLLASYTTFGVIGPGLFGFGASLAIERDGGLLTLKRALPMPPGAYLLGKMVMAMIVASLVVVLLLTLGLTLGGVSLTPLRMLAMLAAKIHPACRRRGSTDSSSLSRFKASFRSNCPATTVTSERMIKRAIIIVSPKVSHRASPKGAR